MKITRTFFAIPALACALAFAAPIDDIGALSVQGNQVVGANGQPAQLRGMSFFWNIAEEARDYWNANVVNWLAEDWHANLVRAAMAVEDNWGEGQKGYAYNQSGNQAMVEKVVDAAIAKGIYVIIDWHSHWTNDRSAKENGKDRWQLAQEFFTAMATKYGQYPNVIYEIYNEPGTDDWSQIKPYAEYIIPIIRAIDPDNLILVGTPKYSGDLTPVVSSPLSSNYSSNVAYVFHFYASEEWHLTNYLPAAKSAMNTLPLFISECGLTPASGNGTINYSMVNTFWDWLDQTKLSWAAWSIVNKDETSAALQKSASASGNWSESDLRESGKWLRGKLRSVNPEWTPISGATPTNPDNPNSPDAPAAIAEFHNATGFLFAGNTISINLKGQTKVELLDLQGRTVSTLWNGSANGNVALPVNAKPGLYLVRIQGAGLHETYKVAVK
jgi:endoglucanase